MLKRFMTWLLRRLQGLMGALNGKRDNSTPPDQSLRDRSDGETQQASAPRLEQRNRAQSISTSRGTVPIVAHLPDKPADQSSAEPDNLPANDLPDATMPEPDTHRRLDAAAAAPANIETVTPTFPTNVSELLSSDQPEEPSAVPDTSVAPELNEVITPTTSVRSLKKVASDRQLPGIHDVLPAIEPAVVDEPVKPESVEADASRSDASETPLVSEPAAPEISDTVSADISKQTEELPDVSEFDVTEPDLTEPDLTEPDLTEPDTTAEQAVLFSFDIVERAADPRGDEPLAEEVASATFDTPDPALDDKSTDLDPAAGEILIDVSSPDETLSAEPPLTESLDAKVETLPYPWSLPASEAKQQPAKDTQPKNVVLAAKTTDTGSSTIDTTDSEQAIASTNTPTAQPDTRPIKNGVVKLLFTLKEGNFHGYIAPDDGSKDILFHQKYINADIFAHLERGVPVTASVKYIEGKAYATRVDLL